MMLSVVATVAALVALLAFAPFASATSDPVASGTTTITLNKGFFKKLKKYGIKVLKVSPGKVKANRVTLPVAGGSMDPTNGLGTLELSGGMKFKAGKKSAPVNTLVLETSKSALTAKVAGKKMKMASVKGLSFVRNGFGVNVNVAKLKLTSKAAKQLNKKLGFSGKKKGGKKSKRAAASKAAQPPFKGNQVLGGSASETQPKTVTLLPSGNVNLATNPATIKKLADVKVEIEKVGTTGEPSLLPSPTYAFPISGGNISPTASAGTVLTNGGLKLKQKLPTGPESALTTNITLGSFNFDFSAKTITVEVIAESNASKELNLGNLGRSSVADISLTGATVTSDPTTRTVSVQNASATLQPVAAEVLNGFSKVYEGYLVAVLQGPPEFLTEEQAKAAAAALVKDDHIVAGDPLGTISFAAQTQ
jgi:hypothetical protein